MTRREAFKGLATIAVVPWKTFGKAGPVVVRKPAFRCFDKIETNTAAKEQFRQMLADALRQNGFI